MDKNKQIVISLGGSIIVPNCPDPDFVIKFKNLILDWVKKGKKFYIITGGGKTCRNYNEALKTIINPTNEELDWLGISATRLNAEFIKLCFGDLAYGEIILDPDVIPETDKLILIGGGWKPGNSSDLAAVHMAKSVGASKVINLSNIDYVYDSDPKVNPNAKKYKNLSWKEYRSFIPLDWKPGMNTPFDPTSSKEAEELGLELAFISGHDLESLDNYLSGNPFIGTIIK